MRLTSKCLAAWGCGVVSTVLAAEADPQRIVIVADSRQASGWKAWLTNLYNESYLYFALATVLIIPIAGLAIGKLMDVLLVALGVDLKSRRLAEH